MVLAQRILKFFSSRPVFRLCWWLWFVPVAQPLPAQALLVGYARLPADTFRPGPPTTNVRASWYRSPAARWDSQPVQGISSLRPAPDGTFWALSDNGFGARANSSTYLLCIYRLRINWRTADGGPGTVELLEVVELKDPGGKAGFAITREWDRDRRLTGADFDPESLEIGPAGNFWIGDEFGPWLLLFSKEGELLAAPIPAALAREDRVRLIKSPGRSAWFRADLQSSRGFEGLTWHPGRAKFFLLLEGNLRGEPADRLRIFEYSPGAPHARAISWRYPLEAAEHSIGELTWWPQGNCFLVLERDWGHGSGAAFKKVFAWQPAAGNAVKWELADLMDIDDPHHLADTTGKFALPYVTIEAVHPVDDRTLIVCNDNNFPARGGRSKEALDGTEFVLLQVDLKSKRR